ncbi:hypothetical protein GCM10023340_05650 [Nocardioides marinquilinus]|uniref:PH domain-containing protein n=1 Tax=Nocardioides marinquilinus TaxID=1210400 RepID=A0ABP9P853_9ACTN
MRLPHPGEPLPPVLELRQSPWRMTGIAVLALLMVLGSLLVMVGGAEAWPLLLVGGFGVLFFGAALVFAVSRAVRRPVAVRLDHEGFVDRTALGSPGAVPWREVLSVRPAGFGGQPFVGVALVEPGTTLARLPGARRRLAATNARLTGHPVNLNVRGLGVSDDELAALMERYRLASGGPGGPGGPGAPGPPPGQPAMP